MVESRTMKVRASRLVHFGLAALALSTAITVGCRKASDPVSKPVVATSPTPQTPLERDLDYVRLGQFTYMFVFSRKDGGVFTSEDISYLKSNSPKETNQWVSSDGGRRVIAGTNFEFKQEHFDALSKRFQIANYTGK